MKKILFYSFILFAGYQNVAKCQSLEIKEFQQKKAKTFISNGEGKSKGLKFSIQYPTSYILTDINEIGIVKGFCNNSTDGCFMIGLLKHEEELSAEGKTYMLSQEILKKTMKSMSPTSEYLSYKNNFSIAGYQSAYIEFKANYDNVSNAFTRVYSILLGKYSILVTFIIPIQKRFNTLESASKFNAYDPFFNLVINSFKPLNVQKEKVEKDFDLQEYLNYKDQAPDPDKSKANETWINELYRNKKYKFRVVFPKNWEYDGGTSKGTLARAYNRENAVAISIIVRQVDPPIKNKDSNNIHKMPAMTKDQMNTVLELQNMKVENFKSEKGYLNNFPAYLYESTSQQSAGTETYTYLSKQVQCLYGNKVYVLGINLPIENWDDEMMIHFDRVVKSFVFEIVF